MTKSNRGKKTDLIWSFFSSIKLTFVLLIILATTSIFGTVIPQQQEAMQFAHKLSPGLFQILSSLQFFDMYHSIWFRVIICALALNLIVCSIDRFPTTLKLFRALPRPDRFKPFENLPPQRGLLVKGEIDEVSVRVADILKGLYKKIQIKNIDKQSFFYCEKGRYSYFGVYLVHLSILIILIGGIIGSLFGFEAYVNIEEGEAVDTVILRKNRIPKKLGFNVRCEKFRVVFYDNGTPKEYRSVLSFLNGGEVAHRGDLLVNHPINFRGISFYQSSYGTSPGDKVQLKISKNGFDLANPTMEVKLNRPVPLPGNGGQFLVGDIRDDFMRMGPAALIVIKPSDGDETRFWVFQHQDLIRERFPEIFKKFPKLNPALYKPYTFYLDKIESRYYTGLQVNKDPGVLFVWVGFFMIVIGFFITFFMSHRRVWVRVSTSRNRLRISVAGRANKNHVGLERELDQVAKSLRDCM